jgi:hypothetical protein
VRSEFGHDQAIPEVELVERKKRGVPGSPLAALEVRSKPAKTLVALDGIDERVRRDARPDVGIEVGARTLPEGSMEAIRAVMGDRDRKDLCSAERGHDVLGWDRPAAIHDRDAREILSDEPEGLPDVVVPGEDHDSARGNSPHLG